MNQINSYLSVISMGYNGSNRKGYDVRYRGFPKSASRYVDSMVFGRHGLLTGAAKLVYAGIKDLTQTPTYSKTRSSGTYYVFKTSSGLTQKDLLNIDLHELSNSDYSVIISDYFERRKEFELLKEQERALSSALLSKRKSLNLFSILKFLFKRRIRTITSEIDTLKNKLEEIEQQPIDVSFRLDNVSSQLDQMFIDSFMHLFRDTKTTVVVSSERTCSPHEIPSFCHFYEIGRGNISINTEDGPLTDVKCCSITLGNIVLYFYSDVLIITNSTKEMAIVNYDDITLSNRSVSIVEDQGFSTYGYNVRGQEFLHERIGGGPDRRYSYNPSRPIICYYNLVLRYNKRILFNFISNIEGPVKEFISSFNLLKGGWYYMNVNHLSREMFDIFSSCANSLHDIKRTCCNILDHTNNNYKPYINMSHTMVNNHVCHFMLLDLYSTLVEDVKEDKAEIGMWAMLFIASKILNYYSMYNSCEHLKGLLAHAPQIFSAIQKKLALEIPGGREYIDVIFLLGKQHDNSVEKYRSTLDTLKCLIS